MSKEKGEFAGRRILVVGLGVSGFAAARALDSMDAKVQVTEGSSMPDIERRAEMLRAAGIEVETGGHDIEGLGADIAILSPGIPPWSPVVEALRAAGVEVMGEVELAYRLGHCDFLAVTGTNGKTTTTTLLAAMLAEGGIPSLAAGNIGLPVVEAVGSVPAGGAIALEVSSFQLATITSFRARVAILLNIAEDHTDWHTDVESYAASKARIIENQQADDVFVFNADDERCVEIASRAVGRTVPFSAHRASEDGIGLDGTDVVWRRETLLSVEDIVIPGIAGIEDAMGAAAAALEYGVDRRAVVRAVKAFRPLSHRLETVAQAGSVTYIDDSKATNPHATLTAVVGLTDVVLIAGGRSKGTDLSVLAETIPPVIAVIALGEATDQIIEAFQGRVPVERAGSMEDAVERADRYSNPGGSVLLSPACASLDMYESYAQRGEAFARAVRKLLKQKKGGLDGQPH